jgi:hypothetical protein
MHKAACLPYVHGSTAPLEKTNIFWSNCATGPPVIKYFTVLYCNRSPPRWNFPTGTTSAGGAGAGGAGAGAGAGGAGAGGSGSAGKAS